MPDYQSQTIALVGVSADTEKYGFHIFQDLLKNKYHVLGVNPKGEPILDQPIYQTLADLPETPDIVLTVVPPAVTSQIVDQCQQLGLPFIWMQPGSHSPEVVEKAERLGLKVVADECFMVHEGMW